MKKWTNFFFSFVFAHVIIAQTSKEEILNGVRKHAVIVTEIDSTLVMIEDHNKMKREFFDLGTSAIGPKSNALTSADTMVIDFSTLDTSLYSGKYQFWQEVAISNSSSDLMVGDLNNNKQTELYGMSRFLPSQSQYPSSIFEMDSSKIFREIFTYPDSVNVPYRIDDINGDHIEDIFFSAKEFTQYFIFSSPLKYTLPTQMLFAYQQFHSQVFNFTSDDFDKDNKTDMIIMVSLPLGGQSKLKIAEYNASINNLDTVFTFVPPDEYINGFAIDDFDMDGRTEIVMGSIHGDVYVLECDADNSYSHVWTSSIQTKNAYLEFKTDDIDDNGKKEFWVGGENVSDGIKLVCFESSGDNQYEPKYVILVPYLFTIIPFKAFASDMDSDGKVELCFAFGDYIIILKFKGSPDYPSYSIWYFTINELIDQNGLIDFVSTHDINNDGKPEILIQFSQVVIKQWENEVWDFTRIYNPTTFASVSQSHSLSIEKFELLQNYPNPFNPSTTIKFSLREEGFISVTVTDILGRKIKSLLKDKYQAGDYKISWDGKNESGVLMNSGVYFITMKAENFAVTLKSVLVK